MIWQKAEKQEKWIENIQIIFFNAYGFLENLKFRIVEAGKNTGVSKFDLANLENPRKPSPKKLEIFFTTERYAKPKGRFC